MKKLNPNVISAAFAVLVLVGSPFVWWLSRDTRLVWQGNALVRDIESYREQNQRLPESIAELSRSEIYSEQIFYSRESDETYIVWFGQELGESATYRSDLRVWNGVRTIEIFGLQLAL